MFNKITHYDIISIKDFLKARSPFNIGPMGLVRIFQDGVLNTDQTKDGWLTNMTIATGREFSAQAVFKKNNVSSTLGNIQNYKVDSFGIGSGGSTIVGSNNVTLNGPSLCDSGLYAPIQINTSCLASKNNDNEVVDRTVKKIESSITGQTPGSITIENPTTWDFDECSSQYFTVVKNSCIITSGEPSFLNPGESVKMDEAMLFLTDDADNVLPFAHICFPPKYIELETEFTIEWYVIF